MDIERLRKIIEYSDGHRERMEARVKEFYTFAGMNSDWEVLNLMQIARASFQKKGYLVFEMPFADKEIGALCYKGDALGYIVLNTSLPKATVNFALCHELYHVFGPKSNVRVKVEFANGAEYEDEEELAANLFSGMLLMPEASFSFMYRRFWEESEENEVDVIVRLVNYYQAPYMAVLIRCCELGLLAEDVNLQELLEVDRDCVKKRLSDLWLDGGIMEATKKDDYVLLEKLVARFGEEGVRDSYLNERTVRKVLQNMRALYLSVKGE